MQLFEDRDDPTSNVFIEVFEDFIDDEFYEDGRVRPLQSRAQAWCKPKAHVLQTHQATRVERRDSSQFQPVAPRFGIAKDEGLFLTSGEVSMAATAMPHFGASFAEAAYKLDPLNRAPL